MMMNQLTFVGRWHPLFAHNDDRWVKEETLLDQIGALMTERAGNVGNKLEKLQPYLYNEPGGVEAEV